MSNPSNLDRPSKRIRLDPSVQLIQTVVDPSVQINDEKEKLEEPRANILLETTERKSICKEHVPMLSSSLRNGRVATLMTVHWKKFLTENRLKEYYCSIEFNWSVISESSPVVSSSTVDIPEGTTSQEDDDQAIDIESDEIPTIPNVDTLSIDNSVESRWKYAHAMIQKILDLCKSLDHISLVLCSLECSKSVISSKKRKISEINSNNDILDVEYFDPIQTDNMIDTFRTNIQYGMPKINLLVYYKDSIDKKDITIKLLTLQHVILSHHHRATDSVKILQHLCKNHRHNWSITKLRNAYDVHMTPALVWWQCYASELKESLVSLFNKYINSGLNIASWPNLWNTNPQDNTLVSLRDGISDLNYTNVQMPLFKTTKRGINEFTEFMIHLINKSGLVYKNGLLYRKYDKSEYHYINYMSIEELMQTIANSSDKKTRANVQNFEESFVKFVKGTGSKRFNEYKPVNQLFEFKDGIYDLTTGILYPKSKYANTKLIVRQYFDESYSVLSEPTQWLSILKNSLSPDQIIQFCSYYRQLFFLRYQKQKTLCVVGPSGCGKTTLTLPLYEIYGKSNIGTITCEGQFNLQDLVGKDCWIMDEFELKFMNRSVMLKLFEGGHVIQADRKYDKFASLDTNTPLITLSNDIGTYKNDNSGAVPNRFAIFYMQMLPKELQSEFYMDIIREETAAVLVYCNRIYLEHN